MTEKLAELLDEQVVTAPRHPVRPRLHS
jgi:hypothetical protein